MIEVQKHHVGNSDIWFAFVDKMMLLDKRGVGRRFKSKEAALEAAEKENNKHYNAHVQTYYFKMFDRATQKYFANVTGD